MNPLIISGEQFAQKYLNGEKMDSVKSGIAKLASQNKWSAHEIERVVESANRNILVSMSKNASKKSVDPHFTFPTIKTAEIIGMLSSPPSSPAMARAPMQAAPQMTIAPTVSAHPSLGGAMSPEQFVDGDAPSKDIAMMVLRLLRDRVAMKKSKYCQMEMQLNDAIEKFEKMASQELISGTPLEILESCGAGDITKKIAEKLAQNKIKVAHLDKSAAFEVEKNHPLYILAQKIESDKNLVKVAKLVLDQESERYSAKVKETLAKWGA
jgi:hypothetical protein